MRSCFRDGLSTPASQCRWASMAQRQRNAGACPRFARISLRPWRARIRLCPSTPSESVSPWRRRRRRGSRSPCRRCCSIGERRVLRRPEPGRGGKAIGAAGVAHVDREGRAIKLHRRDHLAALAGAFAHRLRVGGIVRGVIIGKAVGAAGPDRERAGGVHQIRSPKARALPRRQYARKPGRTSS